MGLGLMLPLGAQAGMWAAPMAGNTSGTGLSMAFQGSLGVANGEAKEHVFDYESRGQSRRQLSRLDWDLKNVAMGGGSLSVRLWDRLALNGGLWLALSEGSGEMDDYDWLDVRSSEWTHYSLSDVDVTEGYLLDVNAAWKLMQMHGFSTHVLVGYKQDGWTWEDRGVYLLYPEFGYVPYPLDGENMILYEQEFRMPYRGANVDWSRGAAEIVRRVRGLSPSPCAYTLLQGKTLRVFSAAGRETPVDRAPGTVGAATAEGLPVAAGDGIVFLREVQMEGRKRMPVGDFLRGCRLQPGDRLG